MSILIDQNTRVIVQGVTGRQGAFHTQLMLDYGTRVVAGVTPGKGETTCCGLPVFDTVQAAREATGADASIIFVPPAAAPDSIYEAADAGMSLCVCITEGIPVLELARVRRYLSTTSMRLIGPNCPGLITPGECKIGILPGDICKRGHVGVVSRSGTLTYEAIHQLTARGIGQSTAIGIGGDSIRGTGFVDALELFDADPETLAVVLIGEIGGSEEEVAAQWLAAHPGLPAAAFIGGSCAPKGKRMGHAGAIVSAGGGTASGKIQALKEAGVTIAATPDLIGAAMETVLQHARLLDQCRNMDERSRYGKHF